MREEESITDVESLRSTLEEVLEEAHINGVEIEGSLTIRSTTTQSPDWEVQIWEID